MSPILHVMKNELFFASLVLSLTLFPPQIREKEKGKRGRKMFFILETEEEKGCDGFYFFCRGEEG